MELLGREFVCKERLLLFSMAIKQQQQQQQEPWRTEKKFCASCANNKQRPEKSRWLNESRVKVIGWVELSEKFWAENLKISSLIKCFFIFAVYRYRGGNVEVNSRFGWRVLTAALVDSSSSAAAMIIIIKRLTRTNETVNRRLRMFFRSLAHFLSLLLVRISNFCCINRPYGAKRLLGNWINLREVSFLSVDE